MRFVETPIPGAFMIDIEPTADERGFFARTVCVDEFAQYGLNAAFVQQSISWNPHVGTLRGLHYQAAPHEEDKLVLVTRGAVFDVIVDLRQDSPSLGRWYGVELSANHHRQLYIPTGVAHGFQTVMPDSVVFYQMTAPYHPDAARGIRWDDPSLQIQWPDAALAQQENRMSPKDRTLPTLACGLERN